MPNKKYHISAEDLITILYRNSPSCLGFSENAIRNSEQYLGIKIPEVYRNFLLHSGNAEINDFLNHILFPDEISFSYDIIAENIQYKKQYWKKYDLSEKEKKNPYYILSQLPEDTWHTITKNYLVIWYENQGVFHAGILYDDLKLPDPPVYITVDDDFFQWCCCSNSTNSFLLSMIIEALLNGGKNIIKYNTFTTYETKQDINECLYTHHIDLEAFFPQNYFPYFCKNIRTCWDEKNKELFICLLKENIPNTLLFLKL
ncbi:SMI1/KNR4 family protein [Clostridium sp. MD294]|uniref:SMI1/KNR4 family protein n=1 Tax=Clostridium sp. MD294 TaxID=97138 RepID=UPI0002CABBDE|nr:SMI1/KNR4 family protein [Clostridium sp. MD294]NDO47787.1 SMI1/KNR4 family protein [Clostridium sp. MD294]USF29895.1 hypothetical protein C820_001315 [Clostridium sp. MD294]